jgi:alkylhydroperoxidase family enzyme
MRLTSCCGGDPNRRLYSRLNGPSPLTHGEREPILADTAGVGRCDFVAVAHAEVAYACDVARGLVEQPRQDPDTAPFDARTQPLLAYVRKLTQAPVMLFETDADAVFAGWNDLALRNAIAIPARAAFMQRLVQGFGFTPVSREAIAKHAHKRVERG